MIWDIVTYRRKGTTRVGRAYRRLPKHILRSGPRPSRRIWWASSEHNLQPPIKLTSVWHLQTPQMQRPASMALREWSAEYVREGMASSPRSRHRTSILFQADRRICDRPTLQRQLRSDMTVRRWATKLRNRMIGKRTTGSPPDRRHILPPFRPRMAGQKGVTCEAPT